MKAEILEGGRRIDDNGFVMPWYTSPCLEWLQTLDLSGKNIFEFGVGDSTLWYRSKGAKTSGVDSNEYWVHKVCAWHGDDKEHYLRSIVVLADEYKCLFDIVVIDGDYRDECTEHALKHLKHGGYLIIDNWMQPSVEMNWSKTEKLIEGMPITVYKEPEHYDWQTAVIQKPC